MPERQRQPSLAIWQQITGLSLAYAYVAGTLTDTPPKSEKLPDCSIQTGLPLRWYYPSRQKPASQDEAFSGRLADAGIS